MRRKSRADYQKAIDSLPRDILLPAGSPPRTLFRPVLDEVVESLRLAVSVLGESPRPFTVDGDLRVKARRMIAGTLLSTGRTMGIGGWIVAAVALGLAREQERARWEVLPEATALAADPHQFLRRLPKALVELSVYQLALHHLPWANDLRHYFYGESLTVAQRKSLGDLVLHALTLAGDEGFSSAEWFEDRGLRPASTALSDDWSGADLTHPHPAQRHRAQRLRTHAAHRIAVGLDLAALLGLAERGIIGDERCFRPTPFARHLLTRGEPARRLGISPRPLGAQWSLEKEGARVEVSERDEILRLSLGTLGERLPSKHTQTAFRVTPQSVARFMQAGLGVATVRERLAALDAGEAVLDRVEEFARRAAHEIEDFEIATGFVLFEAPGMSDHDRALAKHLDLGVRGDLLFVNERDTGAALSVVAGRNQLNYGYRTTDPPPGVTCRIDSEGFIQVAGAARGHLGLRGALALFGSAGPAPEVIPIDPDQILGPTPLSESERRRRLDDAVQALEPYLRRRFAPSVRLKLLAAAELVDPPEVTPCLLVRFDREVIDGLVMFDGLAEGIERIGETALLVPRTALAKFEELLGELGVPFPARYSSARERMAFQATISRLSEAVAETTGESHSPPPGDSALGEAETNAPATPRPPRQETLSAEVAHLVQEASVSGGGGVRLGELQAATAQPGDKVRAVLKDLIANGTVVLKGRGRGARYLWRAAAQQN